MKTVPLGSTDLAVPNVIAGMMRIVGKTDDEIRRLYTTARDAGIDFFDHADVYGVVHARMRGAVRRSLRLTPAERARSRIQTKTGIVGEGPYFDFSYEQIMSSVEGSLRALAHRLHRRSAAAPPRRAGRAR